MWFLIKTSMVFTMGLVVLSYFSSAPEAPSDSQASQLQLSHAISAATDAYGYVSALCTEKPEVCEKGGETFTALAIRAKEGARVAYQFLDTQLAAQEGAKPGANTSPTQPMPPVITSQADGVTTGTIPLPQKRPER
ncbi:DUF5330 domain-containing protein [Rhizobium sp. FY34]|uniref:DUF5330 domain-containing protein n=1 Tax=Rhizobium sp. FY34 TaxID=2562309 RepID=UPI0010C109C8|nr:DUF5330 domain-containing protein [Rhizobium sp. FY34]